MTKVRWFTTNPPIGKTKYSISYWDGEKLREDGTPFWDLIIYKTKKELDNAIKQFSNGN